MKCEKLHCDYYTSNMEGNCCFGDDSFVSETCQNNNYKYYRDKQFPSPDVVGDDERTKDMIRSLAQIIAESRLCEYCPFAYSANDDMDTFCSEGLQRDKLKCRERLIQLAIDEPTEISESCK